MNDEADFTPVEETAGDPALESGAGPEPVMISALEHYSYCPRQCALIHIESTFDENLFTLRGRAVHENVDREESHVEDGIRLERALPLWSERLGLIGKADLVEFRDSGPYPVEYKAGKRRAWAHEALQLCAQAMCLEEMLGVEVPAGAIFYHRSRARKEVSFTPKLRARVERITPEVRRLLAQEELPAPVCDDRCRHCSLKEACLPELESASGRLAAARRELFHKPAEELE